MRIGSVLSALLLCVTFIALPVRAGVAHRSQNSDADCHGDDAVAGCTESGCRHEDVHRAHAKSASSPLSRRRRNNHEQTVTTSNSTPTTEAAIHKQPASAPTSTTAAIERKEVTTQITEKQFQWLTSLSTCLSAADCLSSNGTGDPGRTDETEATQPLKPMRKEYRLMGDEQRRRFHEALLKLRRRQTDGVSHERILLTAFRQMTAPPSRYAADFLPIHRHFLKMTELALRKEEPDVAIPYCDFSLDGALNQAADSVLWSKNLYGLYSDSNQRILNLSTIIRRLDYPFKLEWLLEPFRRCVDPFYEKVSKRHRWIGGYETPTGEQLLDPLLLCYHSFVDFLWETFGNDEREELRCVSDFASFKKAVGHGAQGAADRLVAADVSGDRYEYEPRQRCSQVNPLCRSELLFCAGTSFRCISKIRLGGNCTGFEEEPDACYASFCFGGQCNVIDEEPVTTERGASSQVAAADDPLRKGQRDDADACRCNASTNGSVAKQTDVEHEPTAERDGKIPPQINAPNKVWFTATVLSGLLPAKIKRQVAATVDVEGLTYDENFSGLVFDRKTYPFWPGATVIPVKNPAVTDEKRTISWISVTSEVTKHLCETFCYNSTTKIYKSCDAEVKLESGPQANSTVPYFTDAIDALYAGWKTVPNSSNRSVDLFLFLCPEDDAADYQRDTKPADVAQGMKQCTFERWDHYLLIGFAAAVFRNVDVQQCKRLCAVNEMGVNCTSLMYWPKTRNCVLNSESRNTKANLFEKYPTQDVVYMDYYCEYLKPIG